MGVRGPDLRAIDHEVIALIDRAGLDRGEVGAVIRLREPLAPDLVGARDAWDVTLLLLRRAPLHQGGTDARDPLEIDHRRRLGPIELLVVDDLLQEGCAAAAVFLRPMDAHPAGVVEFAMPRAVALKLG